MNSKSIPQSKAKLKPAEVFPELPKKLARIAILVQSLHAELTNESIADVLGVKRQSVNEYIQKERRASK